MTHPARRVGLDLRYAPGAFAVDTLLGWHARCCTRGMSNESVISVHGVDGLKSAIVVETAAAARAERNIIDRAEQTRDILRAQHETHADVLRTAAATQLLTVQEAARTRELMCLLVAGRRGRAVSVTSIGS